MRDGGMPACAGTAAGLRYATQAGHRKNGRVPGALSSMARLELRRHVHGLAAMSIPAFPRTDLLICRFATRSVVKGSRMQRGALFCAFDSCRLLPLAS